MKAKSSSSRPHVQVDEDAIGVPARRVRSIYAQRVVIERVQPSIDDGRFPVKRVMGDIVHVTADIFADGHDAIRAVLRHRHVGALFNASERAVASAFTRGSDEWRERPMGQVAAGTDEWTAHFTVSDLGWHEFSVVGWIEDEGPAHATVGKPYRIWVDRTRARFSTWYEMFPRSAGPDPSRSATFLEASTRLRAIADLGFDVVYLPPIHPIGRSFRKGRNNSLAAGPGDPGSPWAIGSGEGGHTAVEPGLGTLEDFEAFRAEAEHLGLEVALDLAWQCSPDHPWVKTHPEWFRHRPDGTIKYAENPPKKYQDIYPLDFNSRDRDLLWNELLSVARFWIDRGVRIFRVDNPHTKALGFWEWFIEAVHATHPDVLFLSEAFTRPKLMRYLAKAGFSQSYTYFTWRTAKEEITDYFTELTATSVREYLRPNLFVNTPDILHEYLQHGGRPAFEARLLLAATLGANYGIYSGFELCEASAVSGTEEYADSEKYQYRHWDWDRPGNIKELVARVNQIRRHERSLQSDDTLHFHATDNPHLIAYSKSDPAGHDHVLVVVNLDPYFMQHGFVQVPSSLRPGTGDRDERDAAFQAVDLLDDVTYTWRGEWNYVRLDPGVKQGHILKLKT